jgi:hypothetical protein
MTRPCMSVVVELKLDLLCSIAIDIVSLLHERLLSFSESLLRLSAHSLRFIRTPIEL